MKSLLRDKLTDTIDSCYETPKDGDRILLTYDDHPRSWHGPFIYRAQFEDPQRGPFENVCIYSEVWADQGKIAFSFERVEFWQAWEGETLEGYEERKQQIIAELRQRHLPIDPIDSFIGANAIQGAWSKPKIGPAFKMPIPDAHWARPDDGMMIEVQARGHEDVERGRYFQAVDRIYREDRLIQKREVKAEQGAFTITNAMIDAILDDRIQRPNINTVYSDTFFRYSPPFLPFPSWIRWRPLNEDGTPTSHLWRPGPYHEEWVREERIRRCNEKLERNQKQYETLKTQVLEYLRTESVPQVRLVRLMDLLANSQNAGFDDSLDQEVLKSHYEKMLADNRLTRQQYDLKIERLSDGLSGGGAFLREEYEKFLKNEIGTLQRALNMVPENGRSPAERSPTETIPALQFPYTQRDLYESLKRLEPELSYDTFDKRLRRGNSIEGVPIEMQQIEGDWRVSRKSFEAVQQVIELRVKAQQGWKNIRTSS